MQPTILITGATGQVGSALAHRFAESGFRLLTPTRAELDLADPASITAYLRQQTPSVILNPAAYTAVERAESEPALAHAINTEAPRLFGEYAARSGALIIHYSTDYVFDGTKPTPYVESDPTHPMSVYGRTKLAGEQALAATGAAHVILRTSWVYASTGKNFLLTILKLAQEKPELKIVADQFGAPTAAVDLAEITARILSELMLAAAICGSLADALNEDAGVFHATAQGETTWHGFATEFLRLQQLAHPEVPLATLIPIPSSEYPTPAPRPSNSRLNCDRLHASFGQRLPPWQETLAKVFAQIPGAP